MMLFFALKATDIVVHAYCLDIFMNAATLVQKEFISWIYKKIPMLFKELCVGF